MSDRRKELIERQNRLWNRMQELQRVSEDESRDWTAEERTNWDAAEADLTAVSEDIERLDRAAKLSAIDYSQVLDVRAGGDVEVVETAEERNEKRGKAYAAAFDTYLRHGLEKCTAEQRALLQSNYQVDETRAQSTSTTAGGYFIPQGFRAVIQETLKNYGGLLNIANVITTTTGNTLPWPTNDDTGNSGAILAENTQISAQDLTLGQRSLAAYVYTSKLVLVSWQLLQDSAFSMEEFLGRKLGQRLGRAIATHLATGDGSSKPTGIGNAPTVGKTGAAGQVTTVIYDDLVDLEHSVDPAYRMNAQYLLSDTALKVIRKLKDTTGRPLWVPIPAPGFPSTINGFPYTIDQGIAVPAASAYSILFGDFHAGYIVRQVHDMQMVTMRERYADFLQTGFFAFTRIDAKPDDAAAVRAYQHPAS